LNGAILGMGKKEIERKFDDIMALCEVAELIDNSSETLQYGGCRCDWLLPSPRNF